jgi:hypothetical protein
LRRWASESSGRSPTDEDEATVRLPRIGEGLLELMSGTEGLRMGLAVGEINEVDPEVSLDCAGEVASDPVS